MPIWKRISQGELAALLGVCRQTVAAMERRGELPPPAYRSRCCVEWRFDELREWVEAECLRDPQFPRMSATQLRYALDNAR